MKYSEAVKPISYFKAHAAEVVRDVVDNNKTMIITQNGEAKIILLKKISLIFMIILHYQTRSKKQNMSLKT